jgi:hypothetical protein
MAAKRLHERVTGRFGFETVLALLVENEQRFRVVMHCKASGFEGV